MSKNKFFFLFVSVFVFWSAVSIANDDTPVQPDATAVQNTAVPSDAANSTPEAQKIDALTKELKIAMEQIEALKKQPSNVELQSLKTTNENLKTDLKKATDNLQKANSDAQQAKLESKRLADALNTISVQIDSCKGTPRDPDKKYGNSPTSKEIFFINRSQERIKREND
jgi:chromosome segregation ATPase